MQVLVAGGGIIGSNLALNLAKKGCRVTVLDPTPCSNATGCSWAWLNANKKNPRHYKELNMKGMEEWRTSFPHLTSTCGAILLDDPSPSEDPTYPCQHLSTDQLLQREPHLAKGAVSGRTAQLYAQEGWADPQAACSHMMQEAAKLGAQLVRQRVSHLLVASDKASGPDAKVVGVCTGDGQELAAQMVVLACGPAIPGLASQVGLQVPMLHKPARIAITSALPPLLKSMVCAKDIFVMQRPDGTFMLGEPYETLDEDTSLPVGLSLLERASQLLPALQDVKVSAVQIGYRPFPKDGHPIVGKAAEGLYLCTTHSGMTLAPYLTKLAAQEIASHGQSLAEDLEPYRPQRDFSDNTKSYGWNLYHTAAASKS